MIGLKWSDIAYDIDQQTWRLAKVRITDDELADSAQTDEGESVRDAVMRFAEEGNAELRVLLEDRLKKSANGSDSSLNDNLVNWVYQFADGVDIDERSMALLMHRFVVSHVLWKWCRIYMPDTAEAYSQDKAEAGAGVKNLAWTSVNMPQKRYCKL